MNKTHHIRKGLVITLALTLLASPVSGQLDYGSVEPPPEGRVEQPRDLDGALYRWMATFEDVPVFVDAACTNEGGHIDYLDEFFELWRNDTVVLLAKGDTVGTSLTAVVGYARQSDVVESRRNLYGCLRAENRIQRKVLVVHRWDEEAEAAGVRHSPKESSSVVGHVGLYDILYVYAMRPGTNEHQSDGFCFVGRRPSCEVGVSKTRQDAFVGWLPNNRVFFWDHREGVEYNRSPEASKWRLDHTRPVQFFVTPEDIKAGEPAVEEDVTVSKPWGYYVQRYPIVSSKPELIDGTEYIRVGVIGDSYSDTGPAGTAELEDQIRQVLEKMAASVINLDVLFVIDATGSMSEYYQSIGDSVRQMRAGLERGHEEHPIRYAVLYYRDYTEGGDQDSFVHHFVDFTSSAVFDNSFPHRSSGGGNSNPPPFYAIDTAVRAATWRESSTRVVLLVGDMGNEQPDARGFTVGGLISTLGEYQCEFFAAQARPDSSDPKITLFNDQARAIAEGLEMPEKGVFPAHGTDVSDAITKSVTISDTRANVLRNVLTMIMSGTVEIDDAIEQALMDAGIQYKPGRSGTRVVNFGDYHSFIKKKFTANLPPGIDKEILFQKRIQRFGVTYAPTQLSDCPYPPFLTRVLMRRAELQNLTTVIGGVVDKGLNAMNVSDVWRRVVVQLSGDLPDEVTFDETVPLSEYMTMALGIPVKSDLLNKSVVEVKRMPPAELAKLREELVTLRDSLNFYDNDMRVDGLATEKHWFLMHEIQYGWVPLELMP